MHHPPQVCLNAMAVTRDSYKKALEATQGELYDLKDKHFEFVQSSSKIINELQAQLAMYRMQNFSNPHIGIPWTKKEEKEET